MLDHASENTHKHTHKLQEIAQIEVEGTDRVGNKCPAAREFKSRNAIEVDKQARSYT